MPLLVRAGGGEVVLRHVVVRVLLDGAPGAGRVTEGGRQASLIVPFVRQG